MSEEAPKVVQIGDRLDKYLLVEKLGEGGMGVVFGGVHEGLGRQVAVKLLRAQFAQKEEFLARFQREAESVSRIGHPNIVAVYDFGRTADGSLYYVMERIRGETLRGRLSRPPVVSDDEILALFGPMCRALGAAHAHGIVHRDLKPDNILLQEQKDAPPHVKIVDFGVAKVLETERSAALTSAGALIGTPTYMAPEQIAAAQRVDGRANLYSLGAILYVCVAGKPPFSGDPMAVLMAHLRDPVPPPSTVNPIRTVTPALEAMILRALSKEPDGRPQDAAAFLAELEQALGRVPAPRRSTATAAEMAKSDAATAAGAKAPAVGGSSTASRGRGLLIGAGIAVGALGIAGALFLRGRGTDPSGAPGTAGASSSSATSGPGGATGASDPTAVGKTGANDPTAAGATPTAAATTGAPDHVVAPNSPEGRATAQVAAALDGPASDRRAVLEALGELGEPRALPAILRGLADDHPEVRRAAAVAAATVGRPGDRALADALTEAAQRSGGAVVVELAAARFRLGDAGVLELLQRTLDSPDGALRLRAAVALAAQKRVDAARLRAAVASAPPTVPRALRWAAYAELHHLGDAPFASELGRALGGSDPVAKLDAAVVLGEAGDARAKAALAALATHAADPADRLAALAGLAGLGDAPSLDALIAATHATSPGERARAALALARLGRLPARRAAVLAALGPLLDDTASGPRLVAAAALSVLAPTALGGP